MSKNYLQPTSLQRTRGRTIFSLLMTAIVLMLIFGGLFYWKQQNQAQAQGWHPQAIPVTAMELKSQELPVTMDAVGSLTAVQEVTLSAEVAGRVSAINFKSGAQVETGSLLVQLFDGPEQADRMAAIAKAKFAKHQYLRSKDLVPAGAESLDLLQQRESTHEQAEANIKQLEARLRQKQIRAPFSGELGIRQINLGQYLNPGEAVVTLTSLDPLYVEFTLPQQVLSDLKIGAKVQVHSDAYPDRIFSAQVNAIEPQIDQDTRNIIIQATLPNPDRDLRPGMYVTASLSLAPQPDAILVPSTAVQTSAQGYSAVVIRGDDAASQGKAEIVSVRLGRRVGNQLVVTDGLKQGDIVVTEGQNRVMPGAELQVAHLAGAEEM
ncbi:efflux RND transporter periplasmic adaptor subunit [Vibrio mangrovi]|uniref:Efflux RND transporter periplasmic adaptor subunit n=1 Tax=Vibrio mangrovi TaxID=474394 RepID=A0A1Y6ISC7_9VIBR|nr:efflux RND transporter periplasmic adaptor subunit [Vibrio mangrovi]MDW6003507.1 efflux RND transporter periplasmic adaptor subunit [Vibrio mangrovi]SMR99700.1 Multidrug resistance protein MexA precursor [Vibrio mangrovi]